LIANKNIKITTEELTVGHTADRQLQYTECSLKPKILDISYYNTTLSKF